MNFFSPSLIYAGIWEARLRQDPDSEIQVGELIRHGSSAVSQLDHKNALITADLFGELVFDDALDDITAFRRTISNLIACTRPQWKHAIPLGRNAVFRQLERDVLQCFEIGALTTSPPDLECVQWWNLEGERARAGSLEARDEAWRLAEYRSFMIEVQRLEGTEYAPEWVSIDDNTAGYDIGSWRFGNAGQTAIQHFIEVKHSSSLPRFYISRQEWAFAERHPLTWELQFWFKDESEPIRLDVTRLRNDVAINQGCGRWETMRIEVPCE